mmetsp:Transcript_4670/g.8935  ORF Transcript_4670/g.8935 Transcript_4670/m.8935 type:complete len:240 (-) Transcript_4670:85-804(-)|eukprot:CAMPEP_0182454892 /NCGR_PEP_ID=MMETSP1319-20130603/1317_1 /TAXON_ID=172717 /ORGANISM="Bolidomonas pacifica, Strain RCC208" /LENGTH=239 /DNA_ID=CAMNT_0024652921 /DNA_START=299 /DNA_END=1018 /DNA_ORIENTATION=+
MLRGKRNPPPSLHRTYSSQFHTPLSPNSLTANSNVTWTFHPLSTLVYLILVGLVHITVSVNLDAYMHKSGGGATAYASDTPSLALAFLGLGRQVTADGTRLWYADAWTITAALHGAVTWTLMHWIKGNADFYGQGECNAMTWYEQVLHSENAVQRSYYSYRFLVLVPSVLCLLACSASSYNLSTTLFNVCILAVLVLSKQGFMSGVRLLGINRTAGIDDGTGGISREVSQADLKETKDR